VFIDHAEHVAKRRTAESERSGSLEAGLWHGCPHALKA